MEQTREKKLNQHAQSLDRFKIIGKREIETIDLMNPEGVKSLRELREKDPERFKEIIGRLRAKDPETFSEEFEKSLERKEEKEK
ncbi:MAG: hypothetical protein V1921_02890 [Candidatus Altiarchaeota archaeon]